MVSGDPKYNTFLKATALTFKKIFRSAFRQQPVCLYSILFIPGIQPGVPGMAPAPPFTALFFSRQQVTPEAATGSRAIAALFNPRRPGYSPYTEKKP